MIDHKSSIGKFFKNWNYFKYIFWPHSIRLDIILGEKNYKKHKNMEVKSYASEKPRCH